MKIALVCALLFAGSLALASQDADFVNFMSFVHKFNKTYSSQKEFEMRFANFQMNMQRVYQYRAQHQLETGESGEGVYGVTKFMDLSVEEFKSQYLGFRGSPNRQGIPVSHPTTTIIPTTFDWRQHGAVTPVKDQGQCGSCWAFSATEEVESMNQRAGNKLTELSVQQVVSCDTVDGGCNGGDTITAYQYIEQAGGLELDSNYPYSSGGGDSGTCADNSPHVVGVHNYTYATPGCTDTCDHQDLNALAANLATVGPISICVYAEPWQVYTGGVLSSGCSHAYGDLDHCVQLVGYNQEASTPYWIIRNSWNTDWGLEGYIWVKIAGNVCGVADEATYVNTFLVQ